MNYDEEAMRTLSDKFYGENVSRVRFLFLISEFIKVAVELDEVKRKVFYGKDLTHNFAQSMNDLVKQESDAHYIHGVLGLITEVGEIAENMVAHLTGASDTVNLVEETGDVKWYLALLLNRVAQVPWNADEMINIQKLRKRFPDKFTEENAVTRDLFAEREVLEGKEV